MNRRDFSSQLAQALALALAATGLAATRVAAQTSLPVEGRDFLALPSQGSSPPAGKLEVLAFFSYGCGHCRTFEPALDAWARRAPADVELRRVPVHFLANAQALQRCFFALQAIGLLETMHAPLFAAVQDGRPRLDGAASTAAFLLNSKLVPAAAAGRFATDFTAAFDGFSTAANAARAKALTRQYGIDSGPGVPTVVVAGRWLTSPGLAGGGPQAAAVIDRLLARARAEAKRYNDKPSV